MTEFEFKERTKAFALRVMMLTNALPRSRAADVFGRQLLRSATSVGANYRSACRARSRAEFVSKLSIVEEEADESAYWLELLVEGKLIPAERLTELRQEADEIVAMTAASKKTARSREQQSKIDNRKSKITRVSK